MRHDTQNFLAVGGLALVIIGFVTAKKNLVEIRSAIAASKWPSVDGEIESAGVSQSYDYAGANGSKRVVFHVVVRYSYRLGARTYTSDKSGFDGRVFLSFSAAQRTSSLYAEQKTIKVYVSPEDPMRSMIGVEIQWRRWLGLVVSAGLLGLGVVMIFALFGVQA